MAIFCIPLSERVYIYKIKEEDLPWIREAVLAFNNGDLFEYRWAVSYAASVHMHIALHKTGFIEAASLPYWEESTCLTTADEFKEKMYEKMLTACTNKGNKMSEPFVSFNILCTEKNMSDLKETLKQAHYNMSECARSGEVIHLVMWRGAVWSFARKHDPCEQYTRCSVDDVRAYLLEQSLEN